MSAQLMTHTVFSWFRIQSSSMAPTKCMSALTQQICLLLDRFFHYFKKEKEVPWVTVYSRLSIKRLKNHLEKYKVQTLLHNSDIIPRSYCLCQKYTRSKNVSILSNFELASSCLGAQFDLIFITTCYRSPIH